MTSLLYLVDVTKIVNHFGILQLLKNLQNSTIQLKGWRLKAIALVVYLIGVTKKIVNDS